MYTYIHTHKYLATKIVIKSAYMITTRYIVWLIVTEQEFILSGERILILKVIYRQKKIIDMSCYDTIQYVILDV